MALRVALLLAAASSAVDVPQHCDFAVAGGGWAGIYSAWRVANATSASVCVFEASERFGGRTFTVNRDSLNIDVGAYRFAHEQHLPSDLILDGLRLPTACYMPSCSPEPLDGNLTLYRVVDGAGESAGYTEPLTRMLAELQAAGATLQASTPLVGLYAGDDGLLTLAWADGSTTTADQVLLNLPRHAILGLKSDSVLFTEAEDEAASMLRCSREEGNASYVDEASVKVYLVYDDAWWRTKLGLVEGEVSETSDPPIYIRYHDGPAHGDSGALLVQYAHTLADGASYYMSYQANLSSPLTILPGDSDLAEELHQKLMAMHAAALQAAGVDPASVSGPREAVLGFWRHRTAEYEHPAPDPIATNSGDRPSCLGNITTSEYSRLVRKPLANRDVLIANNDYWIESNDVDLMPPYWAEVSLRVAERVLHDAVGLARPAWLNASYYEAKILGI